jgi:hypothetical protein
MQKYEARVPYTIHIYPPYTWSNTWEQVNRQDLKSVIVTIKKTIECWEIFNSVRRIGLRCIIVIL